MINWRSEIAASLRKAAATLKGAQYTPKSKPVPAQRKLIGPKQLMKMSVADVAELVVRQRQTARRQLPMVEQANMLGLTPQGWKLLVLDISQLPEIQTVVNDWLGLEPSEEPATEEDAYARMAVEGAASSEGEAWVRERIQALNPIREGMTEEEYQSKVDEFMAKSQIKELVQDISEMLTGKATTVAALRRVMAVGSSWHATALSPKKDMGVRQISQARSSDIKMLKEDGQETTLDLAGVSVFQHGDTFFVSWPDSMNVVKYEPAEFSADKAQQARDDRQRQQQEAERLRQEKQEAAKKAAEDAEAALWDGFLVGLSNLKRGQAKKSLDKLVKMNNRTAKTGDHIRDMVAEGYRVDGDRFWNKDRTTFFEKKTLGALPFMYAVFLAEK